MRFGLYKFAPSLWISGLFFILLSLFLSLGGWQLQRAKEKVLILSEFEKKMQQEPKNAEIINPLTDNLARVLVSGELLKDKQFLLDNRVHQGQAGYEVIVPIRLHNGKILLLNRGWVNGGFNRDTLPDVSLRYYALSKVRGTYTLPSKGYTLGDSINTIQLAWPKRIQYLDYQEMAAQLDMPIMQGVVQLDEDFAQLLAKIWKPVAFSPHKHYAYAAQWLMMAIALTILFVVLNTKKMEGLTNDSTRDR